VTCSPNKSLSGGSTTETMEAWRELVF